MVILECIFLYDTQLTLYIIAHGAVIVYDQASAVTARYGCIGIQIICNDMAVTVLGCFTARIEKHGFQT